jgi:serine/threonine protein kinase
LKRYWYSLLGKELYCYKKREDERHKDMHSLVGVFVRAEREEVVEGSQIRVFPFKVVFPINKVRVFYCRKQEERDEWVAKVREASGQTNIEEYYEIKRDLGKGKFGQVKLAVHKKSQKEVAIKVIKKKNMTLKELELQKREIEVLKICQHPNIIRLIDVFENPEYIYIVLDYCSGGDLF